MPIKVEWDQNFELDYDKRGQLLIARGILACVQNVFNWESWKHGKINFKLIKEMEYRMRTWIPTPAVT